MEIPTIKLTMLDFQIFAKHSYNSCTIVDRYTCENSIALNKRYLPRFSFNPVLTTKNQSTLGICYIAVLTKHRFELALNMLACQSLTKQKLHFFRGNNQQTKHYSKDKCENLHRILKFYNIFMFSFNFNGIEYRKI